MCNKRRTDHSTKTSFYLKAYPYNDLVQLPFIIAVCKRCKANLATFSKREPEHVDNDGDNSDDGNEGDDDEDYESDEEQKVIITAKHLVSKVTTMRPLNMRIPEYKSEILFDAYS